LTINNTNLLSLYVHWPYCESKCPYCDFNSHIIENVDVDHWTKSYSNQLIQIQKMLVKYNVNFENINTIFFGGGTPSLMPITLIEEILNISSKLFNFKKNIEITLEANPSSYEREKFKEIKKLGINRLSIGVQSLNDNNLKFLGRRHNYQDAEKAIELATNNFDNVSIDLIYALYGQNIENWTKELESILNKFNLQHLSLYQLTIEEGTKFYKDHKKGHLKKLDTELATDFYNITNSILNEFEFKRYEVSNYAKTGFECNHNLNYWNSENWIGIGPGAYGRLWSSNTIKNRFEIQNYKNPKTWLSKNLHKFEFENLVFFNNDEIDYDTLIMGLRLDKGLKINKLINQSILKSKQFEELKSENLITIEGGFLKVNPEHMIKLNSIINYLIC
jgi:putative oxygen-independent coproporphyrinogen III oxidase